MTKHQELELLANDLESVEGENRDLCVRAADEIKRLDRVLESLAWIRNCVGGARQGLEDIDTDLVMAMHELDVLRKGGSK